jgi:ethanolamine ammonia-lyase small subunit
MNEQDLKNMIENILAEMVGAKKHEASGNAPVNDQPQAVGSLQPVNIPQDTEADGEILEDITEIDLRKQLLVENPEDREGYLKMKEKTPARLGVGRAGPRYKTVTSLRFRADHAAAQDAVFSDVSEGFVQDMGLVPVMTLCQDKDEYITRPDLGRQFSEETIATIKARTQNGAKVQIVVGDGLSSAAIEANISNIIPAIIQGLKMYGVETGNILFVKHCRVPAMDPIGDATGAEVVCLLIGERPGLVTAESMSAYIAYKPTVGMQEARRNVISNIHAGGTPAVEAGAHIADLIKTMLERKASGIDLKN